MAKKQYYLISLKWTYPSSGAFTLWRKHAQGYCWYKEWAGLFENNIKNYDDGYDTVAVERAIIEPHFVDCVYEGKIVSLLLNTPKIRKIIGIKKSQLRGGGSIITKSEILKFADLKRVKEE